MYSINDEDRKRLSYFHAIAPSMKFLEGNRQCSCKEDKTFYIETNFDANFERDFYIYDIGPFITLMNSVIKTPVEIHHKDDHLLMFNKENPEKIATYWYSNPNHVTHPKQFYPDINEGNLKFTLKKDQIDDIARSSKILGLDIITITGNGKTLFLNGEKKDMPDMHKMRIKIGETDKNFKMIMSIEKFFFAGDDYDCTIFEKKAIELKGIHNRLRYITTFDKDSIFED